MIIQSMPYPSGPAVPVTAYSTAQVVALFTTNILGAAYDFTDGTKLAINADGTGGSPAMDGVVRWAVDQSPNGNHLRNTLPSGLPVRRANGVETSGTAYGLFNQAGNGTWANIAEPYEIVGRFAQITHSANGRILGLANNASTAFLQGATSGNVEFFSGNAGPALAPGLNTEFTIDGLFTAAARTQSLNGGASQDLGLAAASVGALTLGSTDGGASFAAIRFKRLLIIGRALTGAERAGVTAWVAA